MFFFPSSIGVRERDEAHDPETTTVADDAGVVGVGCVEQVGTDEETSRRHSGIHETAGSHSLGNDELKPLR